MSEQNNNKTEFIIQRIYIKDLSFEAPYVPTIFQHEWKPQIKLNLNTSSNKLALSVYEVVLQVNVTATLDLTTAFLCEVHQAGIFTISGLTNTQIIHYLGIDCPKILFPYARECISNQITRSTLPPFNLAPVNFDILFMNYLEEKTHDSNKI